MQNDGKIFAVIGAVDLVALQFLQKFITFAWPRLVAQCKNERSSRSFENSIWFVLSSPVEFAQNG